MECRGGLTVEKGAMMTTTESTNVPSGAVGKGDSNCNIDGDGNSDSGVNAFNNQQSFRWRWNAGGG
jgi:hypothetical protein